MCEITEMYWRTALEVIELLQPAPDPLSIIHTQISMPHFHQSSSIGHRWITGYAPYNITGCDKWSQVHALQPERKQ